MSHRRKLLVKDVYNPERMHSLIVDEEEPIKTIIEKYVEQPSLRGIFVVDKEQRFKGVITRCDLLNWARFMLIPGLRTKWISKIDKSRYLLSTKSKEIIHRYSYVAHVKPQDNIRSALNLMLSLDLIDVPVIDKRGKILGDLKLSEILNEILLTSESD